MPRDKIILDCTECKNRNFFTDKNKRKHPERVEWRKYCPRCDTHQLAQGIEVAMERAQVAQPPATGSPAGSGRPARSWSASGTR